MRNSTSKELLIAASKMPLLDIDEITGDATSISYSNVDDPILVDIINRVDRNPLTTGDLLFLCRYAGS